MEAGGPAGLGISFDTRLQQQQQQHSPVQDHYQQYGQRQHYGYDQGPPRPHHLPHLRPLRGSMSYDAGLRERAQAQAGQRHTAPYPHDPYQKQVRIADGTPEVLNGKGGYLPYDLNHLSPLSDFDHSALSDTASGSSRPFSPASMSSLPSSTESGTNPAYAIQAAQQYSEYPIQHDRQREHCEPSYPISHRSRGASSEQHPTPEQAMSTRASRLPAFLVERNQLGRPHSMVDLRQSQKAREAGVYRHANVPLQQPVSSADAYESPVESVPSSAAALQRERFQGEETDEDPALRPMRQSEGRPRRRRLSNEEPSPLRCRSRSLSAFELRMLAESEAFRSSSPGRDAAPNLEGKAEELELRDSPSMPDAGTVISIAPPAEDACKTHLKRQSTLLTAGASTVRRKKELDRLLMPSTRFGAFGEGPTTSSRNTGAPDASASSSPAVLEQAKSSSHARVELDLMLETPLVVEGGWLKGKLEVRTRRPRDREGELWLGKPKLRVIGFEGACGSACNYQILSLRVPVPRTCVGRRTLHFLPPRLLCRFARQSLGTGMHTTVFRLCRRCGRIPPRQARPAHDAGQNAHPGWQGRQGSVERQAGRHPLHRHRVSSSGRPVRLASTSKRAHPSPVVRSVKLKSTAGGDRSIAHFYRHLEVFPYLHPALALAPAPKPLRDEASKALFMGGSGQATIRATMHREIWVAGQRCYVEVAVENLSNKKVRASFPADDTCSSCHGCSQLSVRCLHPDQNSGAIAGTDHLDLPLRRSYSAGRHRNPLGPVHQEESGRVHT